MRNPKTQLEIFLENGGRGDVLSLSKEDIARVYKLPKRIYAPIIHALMKWFMTGERVTLSDPRDDGMLEGFIEHQKANANKRREYLEKQLELANRSVASRKANQAAGKPRLNHGSTMVQPPLNQIKEKEEEKDEVMNSFSSSVRENRAPVDTAPVSLDSVEDAKKLLMMLAPPIDGKHYSEEDTEYFKDMEIEKEKDAVKAVMTSTGEIMADEEQRKFSANTYRKFYREFGHDLFVRAYFRFDTDLANENAKYGNSDDSEDMSRYPEDAIARNPAKVFTARLKRLKDVAAATN